MNLIDELAEIIFREVEPLLREGSEPSVDDYSKALSSPDAHQIFLQLIY